MSGFRPLAEGTENVVKVEVSCDRCRAVISADRSKLAIETGPLRTLPANDNGGGGR
jgi:hypothetical protein